MKKICALFLSVFCFAVVGFAQSSRGEIRLTIVDSLDNSPILGAVVEFTPVLPIGDVRRVASNKDGLATIKTTRGEYSIKITYVGYQDRNIAVELKSSVVDLGTVRITEQATQLSDLNVVALAVRTSQQGDTVSYKASSYKVGKDADTDGLLAKMPGITVTNGGVEAQGESVKKIFVNGKEFMGDDVNAAIKNLPAEIVDKIEVYNQLSDQSVFSGVDDGQGYKAINIVTNRDVTKSQFGKLFAGYGVEDKYLFGGNVHIYNGDSRISIIGMANNLNMQNFSDEDLLGVLAPTSSGGSRGGGRSYGGGGSNFMVGSQNGITKPVSLGVNYNDKYWGKVDVTASYFFNSSSNYNERVTDENRFTDNRQTNTNLITDTNNQNHRFNGKIDYRINDNNSIMIRPSISFQSNDSRSDRRSASERLLEDGTLIPVNEQTGWTDRNSSGFNISNTITYRHKFNDAGRTLTIDNTVNTSPSDNETQNDNTTSDFINNIIDTKTSFLTKNNSKGYRLDAGAMYNEPLSKTTALTLQYRASYRYSDSDKKVYKYDDLSQMFPTIFDETQSSVKNSGYLTQSAGPGIRVTNKTVRFNSSISYQRSSLMGDQSVPREQNTKYLANDIIHSSMLNLTFNPTNTLRVMVRSSTSNPSINDLQSVPNTTNSLNQSIGNPDLISSYTNTMYARYTQTSVTKGRTFMAMIGGSQTNNYIGNEVTVAGDAGNPDLGIMPNGQLTRPVNMNGFWSVNGMLSYGFPVRFVKSNLNLNAGVDYSRYPSIFNGEKIFASGTNYNVGAVLGSNISPNIDFTFSYTGGYNKLTNSRNSENNNDYLSQTITGKVKIVMWAGFTFTTNGVYTRMGGIEKSFTEEFLICNAFVGKKMFKNNRGELSVGLNDIFDQNRSFSRTMSSNSVQNVTNISLRRYASINFVYNLKNFGKVKQSSSTRPQTYPDTQSMDRQGPPAGGPPMGGPPMGGGMGGGGGF